jgi:hypothetical protein
VGCDIDVIVEAIGLRLSDLFPRKKETAGRSRHTRKPITVEDLARDKCLPADFLRNLGLEDCEGGVRIAYRLEDWISAPRQRTRTALQAKEGSHWDKGHGGPVPYGLWRLADARKAGFLILVEGESDCWTLWFHEFPALGIPGADMASKLELPHVHGIGRLYVFREPDRGGKTFVTGMARRLSDIGWMGQAYVVELSDTKDPNDLHKRSSETFRVVFQAALDTAQPLPMPQTEPENDRLAPLDDIPYRETEHGLMWLKKTSSGEVPVQLTNFVARIAAEVVEDDGAEVRRTLEIEATLNGKASRFRILASQFTAMNWPLEHLGAGAIVLPGFGTRDHARAAIQLLSGELSQRIVFAHIGWRRRDEGWIYLHAGGAIDASGPLENVEISLPEPLQEFKLPAPPAGSALVQSIRGSLRLLKLAPLRIVAPLFAAIRRAVLGAADFSIHLAGPTSAGKSELVALAQQHFGASLDARHLPGSWMSTGNANERLAFFAKDAVFVVDDFAPTGNVQDVQRYHREADRLLRAQGNNAGRQRMRPDATLRPAKPPRGLIISTGEDVPKGQSLRARAFILELGPTDLNWQLLTVCQEDAANRVCSKALAGFVRWLAPRYETVRQTLRHQVNTMRQTAFQGLSHRRTPDIVANLAVGVFWWLEFAREAGATDELEAAKVWQECLVGLTEAAAAQGGHQAASEPVTRFLQLLSAALASGSAHVANPKGSEPCSPEAWGWRKEAGQETSPKWRPQGDRIGWVDGDELFLEPDAAYATAQALARDQGDSLNITGRTLIKRMKEKGLLVSTSPARESLKVRHSLEGRRREVLHLKGSVIEEYAFTEPDQPDHLSGKLNVFNYQRVRELLLNAGRVATEQGASTPSTDVPYAPLVGLGGSAHLGEVSGEEVI